MLPPYFKPGMLRHSIQIQQNDGTQGATGAENDIWNTITEGTQWAYIESVAGRERFVSQQNVADITHRVIIRYIDGVDPKMRIKHQPDPQQDTARYFQILSMAVEPEEVRRWLVMEAREIK